MNQELIPVFTGTLAGVVTQLVDARTLHVFLEVGKDFSNWIRSRIKQYDFQENQDYIRVAKTGDVENQGFQPIDYHLTLDMSKELSMVERNPKGKAARRYFIECEKRLLEQVPEHILKAYEIIVENQPYVKPITAPISLVEYEARKNALQHGLQELNSVKILLTGSEFETFRNLH